MPALPALPERGFVDLAAGWALRPGVGVVGRNHPRAGTPPWLVGHPGHNTRLWAAVVWVGLRPSSVLGVGPSSSCGGGELTLFFFFFEGGASLVLPGPLLYRYGEPFCVKSPRPYVYAPFPSM